MVCETYLGTVTGEGTSCEMFSGCGRRRACLDFKMRSRRLVVQFCSLSVQGRRYVIVRLWCCREQVGEVVASLGKKFRDSLWFQRMPRMATSCKTIGFALQYAIAMKNSSQYVLSVLRLDLFPVVDSSWPSVFKQGF